MALSQYSPGVLVREIDRSTGSTISNPTFAAFAGPFEKGPINEVRIISTERQLETVFGGPNDENYENWFCAAQYLIYGGALKVIRTDHTSLLNAVTNGSAVKIKNVEQYEDEYETGTVTWLYAGKTAGDHCNGLRIYKTDAGADQILDLDAPTSGNEWKFEVGDALAGASGAAGKVYKYRLSLTLTGVVGTFVPGAVTIDGTAGTVVAWDPATNTLEVNLGAAHTGILAAGDDITQSSSGASADIASGGVSRKLLVVLNKGSVEFAATDSVDDDNAATVGIATVENEYQTRDAFPGLKWINVAPRPGTSPYAAARNGYRDEMHILVVDTLGKYTGTPNTILERFIGVSKATDAKTTNSEVNYYKYVLKFGSNYIYGGDPDTTNVFAVGSTLAAGIWGVPAANVNFNLLRNANGTADPVSGAVYIRSDGGCSVDYVLSGGVSNYGVTAGAYAASLGFISDPETEDIDFIIPGSMGTNNTEAYAKIATIVSILESRKDCMSFFSPVRDHVVNAVDTETATVNLVNYFRQVPSTSYAVLDTGFKYIYDRYNDKYRFIPCNADIAGLLLTTAETEADWYSPAGLARGVLRNAIKLAYSPNKDQRDRLYVERVNPIVAFPGSGIVLFGDKTALGYASAFDRINVRRLFLLCEKVIANAAKSLLFEFNDDTSRSVFINGVEPFLRNIQARRGLQDYLIKCDGENNPPEAVDRGELYAEIYLKPTRTINYITLTFIATRSGVSFSEVAS